MPVYNGERYLSEAIESIINQSYLNWELIIVNDCSTDLSKMIMDEFAMKEDRILVINNEHNLKLPRSLNVGFRKATGDYFTWTSDDNLLKKDMLKRLVEELENDNECGMVYSDYEDIDENGAFLHSNKLLEPKDMSVIGNVCGASFMYRKSVAEMVGEYDADLFLAEDFDYWMRVYSKAKIVHIEDVLYSYRTHGNSLTATRKEQIREQTFRAVMKNQWELMKKCKTAAERKKLLELQYKLSDTKEKRLLLQMADDMTVWGTNKKIREGYRKIRRSILKDERNK